MCKCEGNTRSGQGIAHLRSRNGCLSLLGLSSSGLGTLERDILSELGFMRLDDG